MKRGLIAAGCAMLMALPANAEEIQLRVAGNYMATGLILKDKEQPFFENMAERTGLPVSADYQPLDVIGVPDYEGFRILQSGLFDIVSLRLNQASRDDPFFAGIDLVGLNPTYEVAREVRDAYREAFDQRMQERFNSKLLALWSFGPQVLFCNGELSGLADVRGRRVRTYDAALANFIESLGGTAVPLGFGEVQQALARGVVDCAITGPSSANSAGWPEASTHFMPIGFQVAFQAYGINLDTWNRFDEAQQEQLMASFRELEEEIWDYSEELFDDAVRCTAGKEPCTTVTKYDLVEVPITGDDIALIQNGLKEIVLPGWAETCDDVDPECSAKWRELVGDIAGM